MILYIALTILMYYFIYLAIKTFISLFETNENN